MGLSFQVQVVGQVSELPCWESCKNVCVVPNENFSIISSGKNSVVVFLVSLFVCLFSSSPYSDLSAFRHSRKIFKNNNVLKPTRLTCTGENLHSVYH